jgi:hypothetical protein
MKSGDDRLVMCRERVPAFPTSRETEYPRSTSSTFEPTPGKVNVHVQEQQDRIRHVNTDVETPAQLSEHTANETHQLGLDTHRISSRSQLGQSMS